MPNNVQQSTDAAETMRGYGRSAAEMGLPAYAVENGAELTEQEKAWWLEGWRSKQQMARPRPSELVEREWTDKFGTHYEARIVCRDGTIVSQVVTKFPLTGWPRERREAAENVRKEAMNHD